jgi:hypothetical protein
MTSLFREEVVSKQTAPEEEKLIKNISFGWVYHLAFSLGAILLSYGLYYYKN